MILERPWSICYLPACTIANTDYTWSFPHLLFHYIASKVPSRRTALLSQINCISPFSSQICWVVIFPSNEKVPSHCFLNLFCLVILFHMMLKHWSHLIQTWNKCLQEYSFHVCSCSHAGVYMCKDSDNSDSQLTWKFHKWNHICEGFSLRNNIIWVTSTGCRI